MHRGIGFGLSNKNISQAVKNVGSDLANKFKNGINNLAENLDNAFSPKLALAGVGNVNVTDFARLSNRDKGTGTLSLLPFFDILILR